MNGTEFGKWLDENGISVTEASAYFGVSEKTIYQWRSTVGVPDRKLEWVQAQMAAYTAKAKSSPVLDRLVIEVTDEQLRSYLDAAAEEGLYVKDWAIQVLDDAAAADQTGSGATPYPLPSVPDLKVADSDTPPYGPKKEKGA